MPNYNSIESNVLFPSMEKYDMDTPGEWLYILHVVIFIHLEAL